MNHILGGPEVGRNATARHLSPYSAAAIRYVDTAQSIAATRVTATQRRSTAASPLPPPLPFLEPKRLQTPHPLDTPMPLYMPPPLGALLQPDASSTAAHPHPHPSPPSSVPLHPVHVFPERRCTSLPVRRLDDTRQACAGYLHDDNLCAMCIFRCELQCETFITAATLDLAVMDISTQRP
ncbi:hypothetical protein B0H14DRAFT_2610431 [Mycena olivaceomarginata]|nr:hypothetical protein B0H14DRAFT_2610431 [Mycena olivaceomarginata]